MTLTRVIAVFALLAVIVLAGLKWRENSSPQSVSEAAAPTIEKRATNYASHAFDPAAPPPEMPPLEPGESAECDSNFISNAVVSGQSHRADATHATVTITQVKVALQLDVNIWLPAGVTQQIADHEQGHRQISEYFYQDADKLAARIAEPYLGKRVAVTGEDLTAAANAALQQTGAEITAEYGRQLNSEPAQLRYDAITDHSRADTPVAYAIAQALKDTTAAAPSAPAVPLGN